jgi:phospholipid/cholesterol/gamma-HCH transport system substrate-binding protein
MERAPVRAPLIKNLEFKVGLLLALTLALAVAFIAYTLYSRGVFERTQRLVLVADNAEGVSIGMPISFSGFPVGQVERMSLTDEGKVRIEMSIPVKDAKWLRNSSVFTLEKSLVGSAKIRAITTNLKDTILTDNAERPLYTGDAAQEIPELIIKVRDVLTNLQNLTDKQSSLNQSMANLQTVTGRMAGQYGVMGGILGADENSRKVVDAIDRANTLLASLNGVSLKVDSVLTKTDQRLYGRGGVMDETQKAVVQINAILTDARESLKKADAILKNTQGITSDIKGATTDLGALRAQVDDSLTRVNGMINELNRKWPFSHDAEVKLP